MTYDKTVFIPLIIGGEPTPGLCEFISTYTNPDPKIPLNGDECLGVLLDFAEDYSSSRHDDDHKGQMYHPVLDRILIHMNENWFHSDYSLVENSRSYEIEICQDDVVLMTYFQLQETDYNSLDIDREMVITIYINQEDRKLLLGLAEKNGLSVNEKSAFEEYNFAPDSGDDE